MPIPSTRSARAVAGRASRQGVRGMTLIEVMVAIVLLSIGMVGLLGLLATATKNSDSAQDRNRASLLANELVSAMWLNNSTDVTTGTLATFYGNWLTAAQTPTNGKGLNIVVASTGVTPIVLPSLAAGKAATITITWKAPYKNSTTANNTIDTYTVSESTNTLTTQVFLP